MHSSHPFPISLKNSNSLLAAYLREEVFEALSDKKTFFGFTLDKVITSGVENPDSGIGVYAGDKESYFLFAALFDPIIEAYHGFKTTDKHTSNLDIKALTISNPDPKGEYILSTRIRVGRNLADMPLGPAVTKKQRNEIEERVSQALLVLKEDLQGTYYPLKGMSQEVANELIKEHFLFKAGDRFLEAAGLNRDWPEGRGIFHNRDKTFLVWVNEEDQLRIISMQKGGDIYEVFARLVKAIEALQERLEFSYSPHLGYITSCPTNLGTAMRASVHIRLPHLGKEQELFDAICAKYHLQIRGIHGEHSKSEGGVYDISNKRRLGVSEVACVQDMYEGVVALIAKERELEGI